MTMNRVGFARADVRRKDYCGFRYLWSRRGEWAMRAARNGLGKVDGETRMIEAEKGWSYADLIV